MSPLGCGLFRMPPPLCSSRRGPRRRRMVKRQVHRIGEDVRSPTHPPSPAIPVPSASRHFFFSTLLSLLAIGDLDVPAADRGLKNRSPPIVTLSPLASDSARGPDRFFRSFRILVRGNPAFIGLANVLFPPPTTPFSPDGRCVL